MPSICHGRRGIVECIVVIHIALASIKKVAQSVKKQISFTTTNLLICITLGIRGGILGRKNDAD